MNKKTIWSIIAIIVLILIALCCMSMFAPASTPERIETSQEFISATYYGETETVEAQYVNGINSSVTFTQKDVGTLTLAQAVSASGARYANADESIMFWNKGDEVTIYKNEKAVFVGTANSSSVDTADNNIAPEKPAGKLPAGSQVPGDAAWLKNTVWVWQKTTMSDGTNVFPKTAGKFTVNFDDKENLQGKTDCNGFFGAYKIASDGILAIGPLASTKMFCEGSQEEIFTGAISEVNRYIVDDKGNLTLKLEGNKGEVLFKKE